jgi:hypothetical protein
MPLAVNDALFALLASHERARANPAQDDGITEDAVWLHTDMGPSYYLTRSGRVLVTDAFEPAIGPRDATEHEVSAALVVGARNLSAPQLLELLPSRPAGSTECTRCRGDRWWSIRDVNGTEAKIICPDCSGRGWTG